MFIEKIYDEFRKMNVCNSRNEFSTEYLGKDRNYMNVCVNKRKDMSKDALVNLYKQIEFREMQWGMLADDNINENQHYKMRRQQYEKLGVKVLEELLRKADNKDCK